MVGCCHHKGGVVSTERGAETFVQPLLLSYKSFLLTAAFAAVTRSMDRYARMMMLMYVSTVCIKRGWLFGTQTAFAARSRSNRRIAHSGITKVDYFALLKSRKK